MSSTLTPTRPISHPGFGDPLAGVGTEPWAERWRLEFQGEVKRLPVTHTRNLNLYRDGLKHRAWTLVKDQDGNAFKDFKAFCEYKQPWGLGLPHDEFVAQLRACAGDKEADLITVPPGDDVGGHHSLYKKPAGATVAQAGNGMSDRKEKNIRAITRAPEVIQNLYRDDLVSQTVAVKMGPKRPTPERASLIAEVRQEVERLPRPADDPKERILRLLPRLTNADRGRLREALSVGG
jgi:hypothetical protein